MSKRIRRAVTTRDGKKICPVRYCEEPSQGGECRQNDYKEPNSDNYAWKWHSRKSISTVCNTQHGFGAQCERNGRTKSLPNCWYDQGTIRGQGEESTFGSRDIPVFIHLISDDMFCMPCCEKKPIRDLTLDDIAVKQKTRSQREKQIREANINKNKMPGESSLLFNFLSLLY